MRESVFLEAPGGFHVSTDAETSLHAHYAAKLLLPVGGRVWLQEKGKPAFFATEPLLVWPCTPHKARSEGVCSAFFFEPEGLLRSFSPRFSPRQTGIVSAWTALQKAGFTRIAQECLSSPTSSVVIGGLLEAQTLLRDFSKPPALDSRIEHLCEVFRQAPDAPWSLEEAARESRLSPSRLMHLFSKEMGIALRPYLRWRRLWHAIQLALQSQSLTEAAHCAGFSDQSHLSRTARKTLGRSLSEVLR